MDSSISQLSRFDLCPEIGFDKLSVLIFTTPLRFFNPRIYWPTISGAGCQHSLKCCATRGR
ncbi:hypothetical protein THICB2_510021 [Thiomonas sp. CB2]|nr:hypothetical protein THICB2_510021 [Thiomonas sp. CB2]VDY04322.1 protein of unknown function [Thiomonas sp. Bio17B3]VDY08506.1 protein of unknown function [Thiomonas sp. Sup16B3]VDY12568.1 conserved protein of unknown function [Thiomonas sp. OC7]VDY18221.1 protein of unknown function [Thiomonas sp. CB2]